jgi:hypothetical protein
MKKLYLLSLFILIGLFGMAQQSLSIPYQALVRDANGNPVANQQIGAKITLLQDSIAGPEVFSETHTTITNAFGQMELQIGSVETAVFDSIDWSAGKMFIRLEVDLQTGEGFREIGTHQLLAVPFAKYAEEAAGWKKNETGISFMDGNVGIGKQNPALKFELSAPAQSQVAEQIFEISVEDAPGDYFRIGNGTGNGARFTSYLQGVRTSDNEVALSISGITSPENDFGSQPLFIFDARRSNGYITSRPLFRWSNFGLPYMTMTANGNLGIGTTTPVATQEIRTPYPALLLTSTSGGNRAGVFMRNTISGYHYEWYAGVMDGSHSYMIGSYITSSHSPENSASPDNAKITVNHDGNVGIGTTNPGNKKLYVAGNFYAYNMKTSSLDLETYIEKRNNKTFSNPSEIDITEIQNIIEQDTTIDLGKMNMFLLEKIDQLIQSNLQQQSQIESQKSENADLRQLFIELKSEIETLKNK